MASPKPLHTARLNTHAAIAHDRMLCSRSCFSPTSVMWVRNSLSGRHPFITSMKIYQ